LTFRERRVAGVIWRDGRKTPHFRHSVPVAGPAAALLKRLGKTLRETGKQAAPAGAGEVAEVTKLGHPGFSGAGGGFILVAHGQEHLNRLAKNGLRLGPFGQPGLSCLAPRVYRVD
jgi:hypothetical protein